MKNGKCIIIFLKLQKPNITQQIYQLEKIYVIENWCLWVVVRQHVAGKYAGNKMKAKRGLRKGTVQDWLNIVHG